VQVNSPKLIKVASLYQPNRRVNDEDDQDCAVDADTSATKAISIAAEAAIKATQQDDEDDDREETTRHVVAFNV
jgi:hypothetical protein